MEKIIDGKRYSTETATNVFDCGSTILYMKNTGEFFVYEDGEITPVSKQRAEALATSFGIPEDKHYKYFCLDQEERLSTPQSVTMPTWVNTALKKEAAKREVAVSKIVTEAVKKYLSL